MGYRLDMPADKISIEKAKPDKLFYFVVNAVIYRPSDGRCLILKRSEREVAHPGKYGVVGGKLEWTDIPIDKPGRVHGEVLDYPGAVDELLRREIREESGLEVKLPAHYLYTMPYIRPDGVPTVMVKYAVEYSSGEVVLEKDAFTDFAWVTTEEARAYPCMDGIVDEIAATIAIFTRP
jgi:8-oxo-dGTP pyrophosphatase MutT (NUDIX family)